MINHIWAILWKQLKDTLKNKVILIQFVLYPVMTIIMENAVSIEGMPEHFFVKLFSVMYIGMAPLTAMSAIVAEEKENNTLRVLHMCNVKSIEYLLGNAIYIVFICMAGSLVIGIAGGYNWNELLIFMLIMFVGHTISIIFGAAIGIFGKNQMMTTSLALPVTMILSFLPMLSTFNNSIKKVGKFVYTGQISLLINDLNNIQLGVENIVILGINICAILACFIVVYRKGFIKQC